MKRLYRSDTDAVLSGVFAGLGDYAGVDPVILRVVFILVTAFTGFVPGIVAYIVLAVIIPRQ